MAAHTRVGPGPTSWRLAVAMVILLTIAACTANDPPPGPSVEEPKAALADSDKHGAIVEASDGVYGITRQGERSSLNPAELSFRRYRCAGQCPTLIASGSTDPTDVFPPLLQQGDELVSSPYSTRVGDTVIDLLDDRSFAAVRRERLGDGSQRQSLVIVGRDGVRGSRDLGDATPQVVASTDRSQALVFADDPQGAPRGYLVDARKSRGGIRQLPGQWRSGCIESGITILVGDKRATLALPGRPVVEVPVSEPTGCQIGARSFSLITRKTDNGAPTTVIRTYDFSGKQLWRTQIDALANVSTHPRSDLLVTVAGGTLRSWNRRGMVEKSVKGVADADLLDGEVVILRKDGEVLWKSTKVLQR